jgi:hypothetical protein
LNMTRKLDTGDTSIVLLVAERLFAASIDEIVTLADLSYAAGEDLSQKGYFVQIALEKLNKQQGIVFRRERGVGWRRLAPAVGVTYAGQQGLKRTRRAARRGRQRTANALHHANDLTTEERRKAQQTITTLGLTEYLAQDRVVKTMPEDAPPEPDLAERLKQALGI